MAEPEVHAERERYRDLPASPAQALEGTPGPSGMFYTHPRERQ